MCVTFFFENGTDRKREGWGGRGGGSSTPVPYHRKASLDVRCRTTPCCTISDTIPYHTDHATIYRSHNTYHTIPYHTAACHTMQYHAVPCHTIPYHTIPHHTILYYTGLDHAIPHHTPPHHTTPHHTTPHHTPHHTTPHHAKPSHYTSIPRTVSRYSLALVKGSRDKELTKYNETQIPAHLFSQIP